MGKFSDRVFGANVDPKTIDIFNALQRGQYEFKPGESVTDLAEHTRYLGEKTTFARMWVALEASGSDAKNERFYYSINDNKTNSYEPNQSIGGESYFVENTENPYLKPNAGITSITTKTEGSLGAVRRTTVDFVVHNKQDFDNIYLPFFLRPGATVILDYGWSDKNIELYDIEEQLKDSDSELKDFKKFIYDGAESGPDGEQIFTNSDGKRFYHSKKEKKDVVVTDDTNTTPPGWIYRHRGLVDTNIGVVTTYSSKVTPNGSFECSVELVSENATILDNEISADNNLKFIFANKFEEILIQALTGDSLRLSSKVKDYNALSASEKITAINKFFESVAIGEKVDDKNFGTIGKITDIETKLGIYYESTGVNNQDTLYVSFGLFNDLFLNSFIAKNNNNTKKYEVNFKLKDYYVRYEKNLYRRQTAILTGNEDLPVFLYPPNWSESRDAGDNDDCGSPEQQKIGDNPYKTPIIPIRELFISVPIIKQAFQKKQTVNDAINFILQSINDDSYGVIDLKMIAPNRSFSEIGIQDKNLINPLPTSENFLTFDVTSGNGIVTNMDYSFETPKGDLQNMIAIGNKIDQTIFDVDRLDNLNYLRVLQDEKRSNDNTDAFVRSLPFNLPTDDEDTKIDKGTDIDIKVPKDYFKKDFADLETDISTSWNSLVENAEKIAKSKKSRGKGGKIDEDNSDNEPKKKGQVLEASSRRDYWGKRAKMANVLKPSSKATEETISPILPVNLTLSVYGNTHLNIGDIFTINFLPKHFVPHVYFQIVGVEHKLGSNWETTYTTQYRVRPSSKSKVNPDNQEKGKLDVQLGKNAINQEFKDTNVRDGISDKTNLEKTSFIDVDDDLNWSGLDTSMDLSDSNLNAEDEVKKYGSNTNVLDNELSYSEIKTLQHVQMAYGFTQVMLKYIETAKKRGKKVKYIVRTGGAGSSKPGSFYAIPSQEAKLFENDIIIDIDIDRAYANVTGALFDVYVTPLSGGYRLGFGDEEKAQKMLQERAKIPIYKEFISTINKEVFNNSATKAVDAEYAPIISRVRFKLADYGKEESKDSPYVLLKDHGTQNYINKFVPDFQLPKWFLEGSSPSHFIRDFLNEIEKVPIPGVVVEERTFDASNVPDY